MKKYSLVIAGLAISASLFISSCQKEIKKTDNPPGYDPGILNNISQTQEKRVNVSTVAELYAAVNDPDNAGARIILAAGTYLLDAAYPNGGRLELQANMTLQGQPGNWDAVWIDHSSLPASSFVIPAGRTGGIRMGRGNDALEWISLKGGAVSANPFSVINTDLLSAETHIRLSHVYVNMNGCVLGINIRNRLAEHAGRKIYADMDNCEITGGVNFNGGGLALQNVNGANGSLIDITMRQNYIHGNRLGLFMFNTTGAVPISNCTILVKSYSDRLEGNGVAIDPSAGVNQSALTSANNNTTIIDMYGTSIRDNNPPGAPQLTPVNGALPGGIYAASAYNSVNNISGYNRASNNTMKLRFFGCDISNNNGTDIYAYGAWCPPACVLAGTNNLLEIWLHGNSAGATVAAVASSPVEPAGTNVVNVYRN